MAQRSGINRGFMWLRKVLQITEETDTPRVLSEVAQPSLDAFGWSRVASQDGTPTQSENNQGVLGGNSVLLSAVPAGVMRYVIYAACGHNDDTQALNLSLQIRLIDALDIGIQPSELLPIQSGQMIIQHGSRRSILLSPGEILLCRCQPNPDPGKRLFVRYKFVDLEPGEYVPPL